MMITRILQFSAVVLLTQLGLASAQAAYPEKPIDIIVAYGPGGSTDLTARVYAKLLQDKWGVTVRVVNQPGGNAVPGINTVMTAKPDGYTVLMDGSSTSSLLPLAVKELPFNVNDRTYMALSSQTPMYFVVGGNSDIKSLKELAERIRKDPATFTWTSNGGAAGLDAAGRMMIRAAGASPSDTRPVISKSGAEGMVQAAGGHIEMAIGSYVSISPFLGNGKLKPLVVAALERSKFLPDIPTTAEAGFPQVISVQWNGFSGPPNLPEEIVKTWRDTIRELNSEQKTKDALAKVGLTTYDGDGSAMSKIVNDEYSQFTDLFR